MTLKEKKIILSELLTDFKRLYCLVLLSKDYKDKLAFMFRLAGIYIEVEKVKAIPIYKEGITERLALAYVGDSHRDIYISGCLTKTNIISPQFIIHSHND